MLLDPDVVADRRRLKRKVGFWRITTFLCVVVALVAVAARLGGFRGLSDEVQPHIARVTISGVIMPDRARTEMLDRIAASSAVKGVIIEIDSPGGATSGGEELYTALRKLSTKKPTTAYVGTLAASAGYMTAIGTDHIVARRSALTGSIGVLIQWPDVSKLMDTVGVKLDEVKSSPMKAEPTPFKTTSPEARAMLDRVIRDSYEWFVGLVAERRGLDPALAHELADGRIVTGNQALALNLVDEIGEEEVAVAWLQSKGVAKELKVRDWKPKAKFEMWGVASSLAEAITRGTVAALGFDRSNAFTHSLDGLQSVWHLGQNENPNISGEIGR